MGAVDTERESPGSTVKSGLRASTTITEPGFEETKSRISDGEETPGWGGNNNTKCVGGVCGGGLREGGKDLGGDIGQRYSPCG